MSAKRICQVASSATASPSNASPLSPSMMKHVLIYARSRAKETPKHACFPLPARSAQDRGQRSYVISCPDVLLRRLRHTDRQWQVGRSRRLPRYEILLGKKRPFAMARPRSHAVYFPHEHNYHGFRAIDCRAACGASECRSGDSLGRVHRARPATHERVGRQEQQGTITEEEKVEMEGYRRVGTFISLVQSKARLALKRASETSVQG